MTAGQRDPASVPSAGFEDFWAVFDGRYDELVGEALGEAAAQGAPPAVQGLLGPAQAPDQSARQDISAAVAGDWSRYDAYLRGVSGSPAAAGVKLGDWYAVTRALESRLLRLLVEAYAPDAERLIAALAAKRRFFHRTMLVIGGSKLSRSEGALALESAVAPEVIEDLARFEARKDSIVDAALDAIITIDHRGRILEFNQAAERIFGHTRAEALGTTAAELIVPARYQDAHRAGLERVFKGGPGRILGQRVEVPARRADGSEILVELSVARLPSTDPPLYTAFLRDVTAERAAAEALRASRARLRQMFDKSPLPTWVVDRANMRFLEVNDAAVALYGYSREEFLRMTPADIRPTEEMPALLHRFARDGQLPLSRSVHRKKNGERLVVEVIGYPIEHERGPARLVVANDITDRERYEERLHTSELRFARLYDAGIVGIAVSDLGGDIVEANDSFLRILGFAREELVAGRMRWSELTPPEWKEVDDAALQQLLGKGIASPFEKEYFRKDRSRVPVLIGAAQLEGSRYIAFVLDISERKRLEQARRDAAELQEENRRIVEASRLKSEFLANMSHELRTPLNAVIGFTQLLQEGHIPWSQAREFLGQVLGSSRQLLALINDILDLAQVEAGRLEFHPEEISLDAISKETLKVLHATAEAKRMRVVVSIDPALGGEVFVDPVRLKQVLYNYLSNALKFTPAGGRVALRLLPEGEEFFRIEVEDTGPGIAAKDIGRLFVQFHQLQGGLTRPHEGTGLGLALTRRLVEAQGGSVGVRSEPGQGSVFHAVLPRRAAAAGAP